MTVDSLEKRIKEIEDSMKQVIANYNLLEGAKAECLQWIEKIKAEEKKE
jgi:hypothetical protein